MTVQVFTPQISVKLIKTVSRARNVTADRFGKASVIDLTPYLNEGSSVTVHKAVNNPNGGFSIRVGDRLLSKYGDSLYGLAEPMDAIEIRMSRVGTPVMVMRGVVTDTSLSESVVGDGKPSRVMTITGGDYGCFLRMFQIHFLRGSNMADQLLRIAGQYMQKRFGVPYVALTAGAFVIYLVTNAINTFIDGIGNSSLRGFLVDTSGADPEDMVYPAGVQANPDGTMWSHLQKHGNLGPFYEAVIDDSESGTTLVYRKPPFKDLQSDGAYIFPTTSAESFTIPTDEITALQRSRSEHDIANFYYVRYPRGDFLTPIDSMLMSLVGNGSLLSKKFTPNCEEALYGIRAMEVDTQHGNMDAPLISGNKKPEYDASVAAHVSYMAKQIKYLQACNVDNVVFESGTIRCNGSPDYKPGRYFDIEFRNGVKSSGYVTGVTHTFEPFKGFMSELRFIRGNGFVNRTNASNPYFYGKGAYE